MPDPESSARRRASVWAGVALLVFTGVSLRAPIVALAPLADAVRADLETTAAVVGSLTGAAVLVFGVLAPLSVAVAGRIPIDRLIALAMTAIALGAALRIVPALWAVLGGSVIAACGIAFGNVLVPAVVRRDFASRLALMTSVYAATLSAGGALAAAATLPMLEVLDTTWNVALALWGLPPLVAALLWLPRVRHAPRSPAASASIALLRSRRVVALSVFMGGQSAIYFATNAWLPSILRDAGQDAVAAGALLGVVNVCNIAGSALAPLVAARARGRAVVPVVAALLSAASLTLLLVVPAAAPAAAILLGTAQGAGLGAALLLITALTDAPRNVVAVSALVQGVGYVLAAAAPVVAGALFDASGGWTAPLVALIAVAVVQAAAGRIAGGRP